jgi:hypothetical protein
LKYLILAALLGLVLGLIYSRLRPYLKLFRKVVESLNAATDNPAATGGAQRSVSKNKLVRCDSCGTWIPAERAVHLGSGLASFCSAECLTKNSQQQERKLAG